MQGISHFLKSFLHHQKLFTSAQLYWLLSQGHIRHIIRSMLKIHLKSRNNNECKTSINNEFLKVHIL